MSLASNKRRIKQMLANAPRSWQKMFRAKGLPAKPKSIDQVIKKVLSLTPTERSSGPTGDRAHTPPAKVRKEAMKGLELSFRENYTSASGIGLARAMQLATWPKIWDRSVRRMDAYFDRHDKDQNARNFGNDEDPSRGYMAWLNWGGDSGEVWAEKKKAQMKGNPMYRKNFFGLFKSKPKYYVYEAIVDIHDPTLYNDDEVYDYLSSINSIRALDIKDAIQRAQALASERRLSRRGANMIFIVMEKGDAIGFVNYNPQTGQFEVLSFQDFQAEYAKDYESNMRLNPIKKGIFRAIGSSRTPLPKKPKKKLTPEQKLKMKTLEHELRKDLREAIQSSQTSIESLVDGYRYPNTDDLMRARERELENLRLLEEEIKADKRYLHRKKQTTDLDLYRKRIEDAKVIVKSQHTTSFDKFENNFGFSGYSMTLEEKGSLCLKTYKRTWEAIQEVFERHAQVNIKTDPNTGSRYPVLSFASNVIPKLNISIIDAKSGETREVEYITPGKAKALMQNLRSYHVRHFRDGIKQYASIQSQVNRCIINTSPHPMGYTIRDRGKSRSVTIKLPLSGAVFRKVKLYKGGRIKKNMDYSIVIFYDITTSALKSTSMDPLCKPYAWSIGLPLDQYDLTCPTLVDGNIVDKPVKFFMSQIMRDYYLDADRANYNKNDPNYVKSLPYTLTNKDLTTFIKGCYFRTC